MPLILSRRAAGAREQMDRPDCDLGKLENTYRGFGRVNRLFSAWRRVYLRLLRPQLRPGRLASLLDIGCGGGDVVRALGRWAEADGLRLLLTGIDADPRAAAFLDNQETPANIRFLRASAAEVAACGESFDFVVSNNVLHHLTPAQLVDLCRDSERLCRCRAVHNDIRRGDVAYAAFWLATSPFFRGSFITPDGLTSIRRSYTAGELSRAAPAGWRVEGAFPYRNLLVYDPAA